MEEETIKQNEKKLILKREKNIIYITRSDRYDKKYRYDLKEKKFEKLEKTMWVKVQQAYVFFNNIIIADIYTEEPHFIELINVVKKIYPNCKSLSTFFTRLNEVLYLENYIQEEIDFEIYTYRSYYNGNTVRKINKPLSFYDKNLISIFKKYKIVLTENIENLFIRDYNTIKKVLENIIVSEITEENKKNFIDLYLSDRRITRENFDRLVNEFNYDIKTLVGYIYNYLIPFENVTIENSLELLCDYYSMGNIIGRNIKKYPKYLKSMHDIILANYTAFKTEYDEKLFNNLVRFELEYEDEYREFCIIVPKNSKDIIKEGTELNHCVASYVQKILRKETYIFFMRRKKNKEESYLTLEIKNNRIIQCKGSYNRLPVDEERKFLDFYCKKKKLELGI